MEWYHVWSPWLTSKRVVRFVSISWASCSLSMHLITSFHLCGECPLNSAAWKPSETSLHHTFYITYIVHFVRLMFSTNKWNKKNGSFCVRVSNMHSKDIIFYCVKIRNSNYTYCNRIESRPHTAWDVTTRCWKTLGKNTGRNTCRVVSVFFLL